MDDRENTAGTEVDTRILSDFLYELNIARRHVSAYPPEHPLVLRSSQKVLGHLAGLFETRAELTLGIARDALMLGGTLLERENPVYRNLARCLFNHGIVTITFRRGLRDAELLRFNELLARKPEAVRQEGGIEAAAAAADIENIALQPIDYGAFRVTEEERIGGAGADAGGEEDRLWENFVSSLIGGNHAPGEELSPAVEAGSPEKVASLLNREFREMAGAAAPSYQNSIADFLRRLGEGWSRNGAPRGAAEKLAALLRHLSPELRRQFLTDSCQALAERPQAAEQILGQLPSELLLEALEEINARRSSVPRVLLDVLVQLTRHGSAGKARTVAGAETPEPANEKLRILFREGEGETFIPADYRVQLDAAANVGGIPLDEEPAREELQQILLGHCVETQVGNVILELAKEGDPTRALLHNLHELCGYFLEMGDFSALIRLYNRLQGEVAHSPGAALAREVLGDFSRPAFTGEVLEGLRLWGKAKYGEIETLMRTVGAPFVAPLLERLATEKSVSLRRYYLDRLVEFGDIVRDAALSRLGDQRWYFVRNLLVLLRQLGDLTAVPAIRPLLRHGHPRVRQEALATLLYFHDEAAGEFLLREMDRPEAERRLAALALAGKSYDRTVFARLLELVRTGGVGGSELEVRRAAVRALGELGDVAALPVLQRVLRGTSLLHPRLHRRLKEEIIRSLTHYPVQEVRQTLEKLARGRGELARLAGQALKALQGRKA